MSAAPADLRTHRPLSAIGLVLLATLCFGVLDTAGKSVIAVVPVLLALWVRYVLQACISTVLMWPGNQRSLWQTERWALHAARGALLLLSSVFAMVSLRYVPLGEFAAIVMATPLLTTLIANRFMAEPVSRLRWALVLGGFAGVLLIIRPGGPQFEVTWLLPLIVVVFNTGFQLLTSHLARSERAATTHFLSSWTGAMLASVALPFVWVSVTDPSLWLRMGLMGAMGALGHYCLTVAYTRAPAVTLSPYLYGHIGSTMVLGWLVFDHVPDGWAMVGMAVITLCGAAGAWLSVRERKNNSTSNSTSPPEDIS